MIDVAGDERHLDRARWRSRRGILELDLMLTSFARSRYPELAAADQSAYRRLLEAEDWRLWDWLQGEPPPAELARIVALVARCRAEGGP